MSKAWLTVDEAEIDLEKVTGRVGPIDSRFAVTGEAPPPAYVKEDDEYLQMYGDYVSKDFQMPEPDLRGIQHMLNMVNDHDHPTYDENENIKKLKEMANTVICISKLNPNVAEFVPKTLSKGDFPSSSSSEKENEEPTKIQNSQTSLVLKESCCKTNNGTDKDSKETNKTDASHIVNKDYEIDISKKIDVSHLNSQELNEMKNKLKAKIKDMSKADSLRKKRENNLAIASLIKLYTNNPKASLESKPLKLMTPDYFITAKKETIPETNINKNITNEVKSHMVKGDLCSNDQSSQNVNSMNATDHTECKTDNQQKMNAITAESSGSPTISSSGISNDKINDSVTEQASCSRHMSKEFKESVKKVDSWLNKPEKPKPKATFLFSPVTFQRKSKTVSASPSLEGTEETERPRSALASDTFVPSSYAEELSKQYSERSKDRQVKSEDIWTKLERELKERDRALLEQQEARN